VRDITNTIGLHEQDLAQKFILMNNYLKTKIYTLLQVTEALTLKMKESLYKKNPHNGMTVPKLNLLHLQSKTLKGMKDFISKHCLALYAAVSGRD
jgi:hypothetical protein